MHACKNNFLCTFRCPSTMVPSHLPPPNLPKFMDLPKIQYPQKKMVYWTRPNGVMLHSITLCLY